VSIVDNKHRTLATTTGKFGDRDMIYQELWKLPHVGRYNVQVSTFTAAGRYAGACLRVDESAVINMNSDNMALRIVDDRYAL
jgi:glutathionylspermidine amidase/synthetase